MGTPLLTASTPVIAVQPLPKLLASIHKVGAATAAGGGTGGATTGEGWPPSARARPTPMMSAMQRPKETVGRANAVPVALKPRKLTTVSSASTAMQSGSVCGKRLGTADTSAPMPAEMATATFSK